MSGECDKPDCEICRELYYSVSSRLKGAGMNLENGVPPITLQSKVEMAKRIAALEDENERLKDDFDRMQRERKDQKIRAVLAEAALESKDEQIAALIADWNKEHPRRLDAEAALAERDYFIDSLHSESGIPTRHWRDTITRYVADIRARAKEGSRDE